MYLWRAVDHEGEVIDMLVQRRRDKRAALRLALSPMDAPCIASGSDELGRNVGLAVIYPALWRGR
jgi:hypothetical protein